MPSASDFNPKPGHPIEVLPGVRRIVAPNPSPMTFRGTNTYLVGRSALAVIDPGPDDDAHLQAILDSVRPDQHISHIIVTHAHLDHSELAPKLADQTHAPVYAFGPAHKGRSEVMHALARSGVTGGGEGVDAGFIPDVSVGDGDTINGDDWTFEVLHTPGHIGNHICLALGNHCFTADHVMGWSTSLVSPPDGDLTDFMMSCTKLKTRQWQRFLPGHGDIIQSPNERLDWLIAHRRARESAILSALDGSAKSVSEITQIVYHDTPPGLLPAAERNVLAHLIDLASRSLADHDGAHGLGAQYISPAAP